ncbi:hypothetical protein LTS18_012375, partial [Coniosporium uncinatum]
MQTSNLVQQQAPLVNPSSSSPLTPPPPLLPGIDNPYIFPGYHAFSKHHTQPLCGNPEGWGPLSPYRYDFTPCFLDIWILAVAVFGVVLGAAALWYLLKKRTPESVKRNWHFYAKLGVLGVVAACQVVLAGLQISYYPQVWAGDIRFWTSVLLVGALAAVGGVQYVEHWRSRTANGVVLFFYLFLIIAEVVKLRSLVARETHRVHTTYFVVYCVGLGAIVAEFALEWLVPKRLSEYDALGHEDECPYEYADIFSVLTFGWMTPMMRYGYKNFLTQDDLWNLRKQDATRSTDTKFQAAWGKEMEKKRPSLWIAMVRAFGMPYLEGAIFKTCSDILNFVQPQLLRLLIRFVDSYRKGYPGDPEPVIRGLAIALAMFAVSVSQTGFLHQYFQRAFES